MWSTSVRALATERNLLLFLIAAGLAVFVFNIAFLPDWAFVDANTHLNVVKRMAAGEPFHLVAGDLFPLWYHFVLGFFKILPLPFWMWNKALALLVFPVSMLVLFIISRMMFPKKYLLPLAFFVGNWWVLNYSSISYIEPFLGMLLLGFFGCFLREAKGIGKSWQNYLAMFGAAGMLAMSKLTGLAFAPLLLFLIIGLYYKKSKKLETSLFYAFLVVVVLFCAWSAGYSDDGKAAFVLKTGQNTLWNAGRLVLNPFHFAEQFQRAYLAVLNFPPNECLNLLVFGKSLELAKGAFFYLFLPFSACVVFGFKKAFDSRKIEWIAIGLIALLGFGIVISQWLSVAKYILPRYTLPAWGFLGLLFCKGFLSLRDEKIKRIVFISFALYCAYSFAYTSYSTYRYWQVEQSYAPGLAFVEGMPEEARIAISYTPAGKISGFAGKEIVKVKHARLRDLNELGDIFREQEASHVFIGCYHEGFRPFDFNALADLNRARLLFKDLCAQLWEIQDYNFDIYPTLEGIKTGGEAAGQQTVPQLLDECH